MISEDKNNVFEWVYAWRYCLEQNNDYKRYCELKRHLQQSNLDNQELNKLEFVYANEGSSIHEIYSDWGDLYHAKTSDEDWFNNNYHLFHDNNICLINTISKEENNRINISVPLRNSPSELAAEFKKFITEYYKANNSHGYKYNLNSSFSWDSEKQRHSILRKVLVHKYYMDLKRCNPSIKITNPMIVNKLLESESYFDYDKGINIIKLFFNLTKQQFEEIDNEILNTENTEGSLKKFFDKYLNKVELANTVGKELKQIEIAIAKSISTTFPFYK